MGVAVRKPPGVRRLTVSTDDTKTHAGHSIHPHEHLPMADGTRKLCSERFWCVTCSAWFSAPSCY
jgi:hypothetical protein